MKQITDSINILIDEQVHQRTCIPLRPDLEEFFTKITSPDSPMIVGPPTEEFEDFKFPRRRVQRSLPSHLSRNRIHDKTIKIRHLLDEFNQMPAIDQRENRDLKSFLEKHLEMLDEIQAFEHGTIKDRSKRNKNSHVIQSLIIDETSDIDIDEMSRPMSDRFKKLARTSEFIRRNVLFDFIDTPSMGDDYQTFDDYLYV